MAHFVLMLTHDDTTVDNAAEIMPTLADTGLRYVGFKDVGAWEAATTSKSGATAQPAPPTTSSSSGGSGGYGY